MSEEPRPQRVPVGFVVAGQELVLEFGHVDVGRALRLAAFALDAQVQRLVEAAAGEFGGREDAGEHRPQEAGAAAGGVLLFARDHVGRAHRPFRGLAAGAHAAAQFHRRGEPAVPAPVEVGGHVGGPIARPIAQVLDHRRRVHDLAGVHQPLRVEGLLDRVERLVDHRPEVALQEPAAHQTVTVFAAHCAAELHDEVADGLGDGPHRLDLRRVLEVDQRPDVEAADAGVRVEGGAHAVLVQDAAEAPDEVRQAVGRHRGVLDERDRLGVPLDALEQSLPRLAHPPDVVLFRDVHRPHDGVAAPRCRQRPLQRGQPVEDFVMVIAGELDHEQRVGIALHEGHAPCVLQLRPRHLQHEPVEEFDRRRSVGEDERDGLQRLLQVVEVQDGDDRVRRAGHQADGRLGRQGQCSLRPHDQPRQIERAEEQLGQVVAGDPAENLRVAAVDLVALGLYGLQHRAVEASLPRRLPHLRRELRVIERVERHLLPADTQNAHPFHVIDHLAVDDGTSAAGVVADHPAQRRPVAGGGVGSQPQAEARRRGVEVILHDTGLHPSQTAVGIDLQDPVHVLGAVQHDGAADRLPGQARPATARQHRNARVRAQAQRGGNIVSVARQNHADGQDLVDAGVRAVEDAGEVVEPHRAAHGRAQVGGQGFGRRRHALHEIVDCIPSSTPFAT